jgi:2-polyprenyl-3-methyl-5-hydroxy-6-metoxy-1,4-benzoquinol methylase
MGGRKMNENDGVDFPEYIQPAKEVWQKLGQWWDKQIGDGNDYQNYLIEPQTEKLLGLKPGEQVLDIACGAGRFARRMAGLGALVTAIDHSDSFIQIARERSLEKSEKIDYKVMGTDDTQALLKLGLKRFDGAVCTMAIMDMACITPMISALPGLLKSGGRFVFSILHPVFSSGSARLYAEQAMENERLAMQYGIKISEYGKPYVFKGEGIVGQPVLQYYFHRPIGLLFNAFFKSGFVLDGMVESLFPDDLEFKSSSALSFRNSRTLPPILVAKMRLNS